LKISNVHRAKPRDCWCPQNRRSKKNRQCRTDCRTHVNSYTPSAAAYYKDASESLSRLAVVDDQGAERPLIQLSHAAAELGVGDLAGKKRFDRGLKKSAFSDEESRFLREKNSEAWLMVNCGSPFHPAEIRIQGDVERQRIPGDKFRVDPARCSNLSTNGRPPLV